MSIVLADDPPRLFRVGKSPDPLIWPQRRSYGRYGDPLERLSTLYAAESRRGAFLETLDSFRPSVATLSRAADIDDVPLSSLMSSFAVVPPAFFNRRLAEFRTVGSGQWLDLRSATTHAHLRDALYVELNSLGYTERFVLGDLVSHHHDVNRLIAGWAINNGFGGIAYPSCHDFIETCWALFEGVEFEPLAAPQPIRKSDPDLLAVAGLWNLRVP